MSVIPSEMAPRIQDLMNVAPVDLQAIADRLGLAIYQMPLAPGVSGVLVREPSYNTPSGFAVLVNEAEPYVRQRFTAAHEIGHYVLHRDRIGDRVEDNYLLRAEGMSNAMEVEANKFAADMLIPWPILNSQIQSGKNSVSSLAYKFQVSEIAMAIRIGHVT